MGWTISQKEDKYRIWSTNSDSWLTGWIGRKEVIKTYYDRALLDLKEKTVREYLLFPHHWYDHDKSKIIDDDERNESYSKWSEELIHKRGDEYCAFIDETFAKIMKELEEQSEEQVT